MVKLSVLPVLNGCFFQVESGHNSNQSVNQSVNQLMQQNQRKWSHFLDIDSW